MAFLIEIRDLVKVYEMGDTQVRALDGVPARSTRGEFVAIMGPSGSGKSTLMNLIGCLDTPTSGTYRLNDNEVSRLDDDELARIRNREIGFVFQTFNLLPRVLGARERRGAARLRGRAAGRSGTGAPRRCWRWSASATACTTSRTSSRAASASASRWRARSSTNPALLLADEPTGNLDSRTGDEIMALFDELNRKGHTIVLVTHEEDIARHAAGVVRLRDGQIVEEQRRAGERGPAFEPLERSARRDGCGRLEA